MFSAVDLHPYRFGCRKCHLVSAGINFYEGTLGIAIHGLSETQSSSPISTVVSTTYPALIYDSLLPESEGLPVYL